MIRLSRRRFLSLLPAGVLTGAHGIGQSASADDHHALTWRDAAPHDRWFWSGGFRSGRLTGFFDDDTFQPRLLFQTIALRAAAAGRTVTYLDRIGCDEWRYESRSDEARWPDAWYPDTHADLISALARTFATPHDLILIDSDGLDRAPLPLRELREQARRTGAAVLVALRRPLDGRLTRSVDDAWDFGKSRYSEDFTRGSVTLSRAAPGTTETIDAEIMLTPPPTLGPAPQ
jgi:hypothetical protein